MDENRFRLRKDNKIVGYEKQVGASIFYSKDEYAWSGQTIDFIQKDRYSRVKDKNRKAIYSEDILEVKNKETTFCVLVVYDEQLNQFVLLSVDGEDSETQLEWEKLTEYSFERVSFGFIQQ